MKVFCIGLNKTGTTSLHEAFKLLGLRSFHDAYEGAEKIQKALHRNEPILKYIQDYDCYSDSPFHRYYFEIYIQYPDAKFILNTRDINQWLLSRRKHDESWNNANPSKPPRIFDEEMFRRYFESHEKGVKNLFRQSDNFMVYDISAGDSWEKLCSFLNLGIPNVEFPSANPAGSLFTEK